MTKKKKGKKYGNIQPTQSNDMIDWPPQWKFLATPVKGNSFQNSSLCDSEHENIMFIESGK